MKRTILLVALIIICALIMCSCDFFSSESQQNEITTATDADSTTADETDTTVETTVEATVEATVETTAEVTVETTVEATIETTEETISEFTTETTAETTEPTTEITDETTDESEAETTHEVIAYGKSTISGNMLYVYELFETHVLADVPSEDIVFDETLNVTVNEFSYATSIFLSDHPECFWWLGGGTYISHQGSIKSFSPEYLFEIEDIASKKDELDAVVEEIIKGVPKGSTFEKALYLHDKVANTVVYKLGQNDQTAYGALVKGEAVCNGYATSYQLLLMKLGIQAWTVNGYSRNIPHAWTVVWLDDETCVYTDVTWDDQDDLGVVLRHYFNMALDEIDDDHIVNKEFVLPECDHDNEGYYDVMNANINDTDGVEKVLDLFSEQEDGKRIANFYFEGGNFKAWFNRISEDLSKNLGTRSISYSLIGREITIIASNE